MVRTSTTVSERFCSLTRGQSWKAVADPGADREVLAGGIGDSENRLRLNEHRNRFGQRNLQADACRPGKGVDVDAADRYSIPSGRILDRTLILTGESDADEKVGRHPLLKRRKCPLKIQHQRING